MFSSCWKNEIEFARVGKHRRLKYEEVIKYKKVLKAKQKATISRIMELDEEAGLYETKVNIKNSDY